MTMLGMFSLSFIMLCAGFCLGWALHGMADDLELAEIEELEHDAEQRGYIRGRRMTEVAGAWAPLAVSEGGGWDDDAYTVAGDSRQEAYRLGLDGKGRS